MGYIEDIQLILESSNCISYRYLAYNLSIRSETAKKMLFEFQSTHPEYFVTTAITGLLKDGSLSHQVVRHNDIEATRTLFSSILGEYIYSIHTSESSCWREEVAQLDLNQFTTLFSSKVSSSMIGLNKRVSSISLDKDPLLLPPGERISVAPLPTPPPATIPTSGAVKASKPVSTGSFFGSSTNTNSGSFSNKEKSSKVSASVSNFFTQSKKESVPEKKVENSKPAVASTPMAVDDEEDDEWDDGSGYKPSKANLQKRVKKNILDDDDAWEAAAVHTAALEKQSKDEKKSNDNDKSECNSVEMGVEEAEKLKAKKKVYTRGAMDDFVNDHSFEGDDEPKAVTASATALGPNNRKKKLVEKTFEDAKGYLVTEMVYEEMTEEEEQAELNAAIAAKAAAEASAAKRAALAARPAVATKKTGSGAAQKSMMSFFGKK